MIKSRGTARYSHTKIAQKQNIVVIFVIFFPRFWIKEPRDSELNKEKKKVYQAPPLVACVHAPQAVEHKVSEILTRRSRNHTRLMTWPAFVRTTRQSSYASDPKQILDTYNIVR